MKASNTRPWAVAKLEKVKLVHPITYNGTEYRRGIHELPKSMAELFLATASHAKVDLPLVEPILKKAMSEVDTEK